MIFLATAFFVALSPGIIVTIPPGKGPLFASGKTSLIAVLVHAIVFYFALSTLDSFIGVEHLKNQGEKPLKVAGVQCRMSAECDSGVCSNGVCE